MKSTMIKWFAVLALFGLSLSAPAQQLAVGRDYVLIEPAQITDNPAKIEVLEFFSYACPHCGDLDPHITSWIGKLPSDVVFKRVPVGFGDPFYQRMARLYYTLETIGELEKLHTALFNAIQVKGLRLVDEQSILQWVTAQGVEAKKFSDAFNSFGVISKTKRADQLAQAAKIKGVPALVVDGRYLVTGKEVKSHPEMLALTDKVIQKARAEHSPKKK